MTTILLYLKDHRFKYSIYILCYIGSFMLSACGTKGNLVLPNSTQHILQQKIS
jgi:predicted small lipoprotein YifL